VTLKVTQGHWCWCHLQKTHDLPSVFHCNYTSLSCTITEILSITSQNLRGNVTHTIYTRTCHVTHLSGIIYHACTSTHIDNQHTKFEEHNFTHSKNMTGPQNLKVGNVTLTTPLSGVVFYSLQLTYLPNLKSLSPPVTTIWKATQNAINGTWLDSWGS